MKENIRENLKPIIFIVAVLVLSAISAFPQRALTGKIVEVIDGKTCVFQMPTSRITVILQYVEVPEADQPLHRAMKAHLEKLVLDKYIEFNPRTVLKEGTVGQVLIEGVDISQQLLRDGAAWYMVPEKDSQKADERALYETSEAQAKAEKRGVWGAENLKPWWVIRAERAALEKKLEEEAAKKAIKLNQPTSQTKTPVQSRKNAPKTEMWADVGGATEFDQPLGVGGLRAGYNPTARVGHISTPSVYLDFPKADLLQPVESRLFFIYRGDKTKIEDSAYVVGFLTSAKEYKFAKTNSLTITADSQKINLGKARRYFQQDISSVKELLLYRITKAQLQKIIKAEKLSVQIGGYKGILSKESLEYINNLLTAS